MGKLQGKVAVITGGNSGIGLETAKRFVSEGAKVVIAGRSKTELDNAVKMLGTNATGCQVDVAKLQDIDQLYKMVKEKFGKIDIVFANAGIANFSSVYDVTEEHFDDHFNINVKGLYFTVQKSLPLLNDGGVIILNSSIAEVLGNPMLSVYAATKAAVRSFAKTLSRALKDRKIRVNAISPGPIDTPIFSKLGLTAEELKEYEAKILQESSLGRMGTPDEIAKALVFLASDDSSYITGINLCVDGGLT